MRPLDLGLQGALDFLECRFESFQREEIPWLRRFEGVEEVEEASFGRCCWWSFEEVSVVEEEDLGRRSWFVEKGSDFVLVLVLGLV